MFDRFTDHARATMSVAREMAQTELQETVSTTLILAAMLELGEIGAVQILKDLGVETLPLRNNLLDMLKNASQALTPGASPPLSQKTRRALELAMREADTLGHRQIGSEHLLLGILDDPEAPATRVLTEAGIHIDAIRTAVMRMHESGLDEETAQPSAPARRDLGATAASSGAAGQPDMQHLIDLERRIAELDHNIWTAIAARDFHRAAGLEEIRIKLIAERDAQLGMS